MKDNIASTPFGILSLNVVMKNPTPAAEFGRPEERSRLTNPVVGKEGRCHPSRSPNKPPSLNTPSSFREPDEEFKET